MKESKKIRVAMLCMFLGSMLLNSCMYKNIAGEKHVNKPQKVNSISIKYDVDAIYSYGDIIPLGIEMIAKRKLKKTTGFLRGDLSWDNFDIEVQGGDFHDGVIYVEPDKEKVQDRTVDFMVKLKGNRSVRTSVSIPLKTVESLELEYDKSNALLGPRGKVYLGIISTYDNNEVMYTEGYMRGNKEWGIYRVEVEGGSFKDGVVTVGYPEDHMLKIKASLFANPDIVTEMKIPLNYKGKYTAYFDGPNGRHGRRGRDGNWGKRGRKYSSLGGNGNHGRNGQHGQNGEPGIDGLDGETVDVYVSAEENEELGMTIISVLSVGKFSGKKISAKFTPEGGSFTIYARGGHGGDGGFGGRGGRGGDGGDGDIKREQTDDEGNKTETCGTGGNGGFSGNGGRGGNSGDGGNGGVIVFHIDPSAKAYQYLIRYDNRGGNSGQPGMGGYSDDPGQGGQGGCKDGRDGRRGMTGMTGYRGLDGRNGSAASYIIEKVNIKWEELVQS